MADNLAKRGSIGVNMQYYLLEELPKESKSVDTQKIEVGINSKRGENNDTCCQKYFEDDRWMKLLSLLIAFW